jgi:prepilin-type N-terminal cleavage/methylation domain-containing protein
MMRGFTLIEIMVSIGVMVVLITSMVAYSNASRQQIALQLEKVKIAQVILKAKELAIGTFYQGVTPPCAYGVHFDHVAQTYTLRSYDVAAGGCATPLNNGPTNFTSILPVNGTESDYAIDKNSVKLVNSIAAGDPLPVEYVLFEPPGPKVYVWLRGVAASSTNVTDNLYLKTTDGGGTGSVSINSAGQVTF